MGIEAFVKDIGSKASSAIDGLKDRVMDSFKPSKPTPAASISKTQYTSLSELNAKQTAAVTAAYDASIKLDKTVNHVIKGNNVSTASKTNNWDEQQGAFGYKVRLFAVRNFPNEFVVFEASPVVSESRSVEYAQVSPVHLPGSIQVYKKTNSRTISLSAKLVSRNVEQATQNMKYLQLLRGWTMPYFGEYSSTDESTMSYGNWGKASQSGIDDAKNAQMNMLGAPPDVLYLYAYSSSSQNVAAGQKNIKKLPVVITNLSFDYPDSVDYLPTEPTGEPFPIIMDVKIELLETHAPSGTYGYETFSLSLFKQGRLTQY